MNHEKSKAMISKTPQKKVEIIIPFIHPLFASLMGHGTGICTTQYPSPFRCNKPSSGDMFAGAQLTNVESFVELSPHESEANELTKRLNKNKMT